MRAFLNIAGGLVLLVAGCALLVLPGPGIPLLIAGLFLWAREFGWAKRAAVRLKAWHRLARLRLHQRKQARTRGQLPSAS